MIMILSKNLGPKARKRAITMKLKTKMTMTLPAKKRVRSQLLVKGKLRQRPSQSQRVLRKVKVENVLNMNIVLFAYQN